MFENIKEKRVLITGASGGIGSSMAYLFAEYGAVIGVHYNQSKNDADQIVLEIERNGGRGASFQADLCSVGWIFLSITLALWLGQRTF
jgi:3-oxoacyl-[acyl-carrier protein] reductase